MVCKSLGPCVFNSKKKIVSKQKLFRNLGVYHKNITILLCALTDLHRVQKQYFILSPWLAMYHGQELLSPVKTHHGHTPRSHYHRACSNMVGNEKQYYHGQPLAGADCLEKNP